MICYFSPQWVDFQGFVSSHLAAVAVFCALVDRGFMGMVRESVGLFVRGRNHACRGETIPAAVSSVAMLMWAEGTVTGREPVDGASDKLKTIAASAIWLKSNGRLAPW